MNHQKIKEHLRVNSNVFKYIFQSVSDSYPTGYRPAFCLSNQRGEAGIIELFWMGIVTPFISHRLCQRELERFYRYRMIVAN